MTVISKFIKTSRQGTSSGQRGLEPLFEACIAFDEASGTLVKPVAHLDVITMTLGSSKRKVKEAVLVCRD